MDRQRFVDCWMNREMTLADVSAELGLTAEELDTWRGRFRLPKREHASYSGRLCTLIDPTLEEIRERAAEVRAGWSEHTERLRRTWSEHPCVMRKFSYDRSGFNEVF